MISILPSSASSLTLWAPEHDLDRGGAIRAVPRSHDPLVRDEGAATEPLVINEEGGHPGVLVRAGLLAPHYAGVRPGHAALPGHAPGARLVARQRAGGRPLEPRLQLAPVLLPGLISD